MECACMVDENPMTLGIYNVCPGCGLCAYNYEVYNTHTYSNTCYPRVDRATKLPYISSLSGMENDRVITEFTRITGDRSYRGRYRSSILLVAIHVVTGLGLGVIQRLLGQPN